jgi:hypothetical protein
VQCRNPGSNVHSTGTIESKTVRDGATSSLLGENPLVHLGIRGRDLAVIATQRAHPQLRACGISSPMSFEAAGHGSVYRCAKLTRAGRCVSQSSSVIIATCNIPVGVRRADGCPYCVLCTSHAPLNGAGRWLVDLRRVKVSSAPTGNWEGSKASPEHGDCRFAVQEHEPGTGIP